MKAWEIKDTFGIDALTTFRTTRPPAPTGQVRIRVKAVSLNYRDFITVKQGGARGRKVAAYPLL